VHDVPPDGMASRTKPVSAQMRAQLQAEALARVTSQRLTVIKKPPTQVFDASAPVIVVADEKKSMVFVILAIVALLGVVAFAVLFLVM